MDTRPVEVAQYEKYEGKQAHEVQRAMCRQKPNIIPCPCPCSSCQLARDVAAVHAPELFHQEALAVWLDGPSQRK